MKNDLEIEADISFYQPVIIITMWLSCIFIEALPAPGRLCKRPTEESLIYLFCYGWNTRAKGAFLGTRGVGLDTSTFQFPRRKCVPDPLLWWGHLGLERVRCLQSIWSIKRKRKPQLWNGKEMETETSLLRWAPAGGQIDGHGSWVGSARGRGTCGQVDSCGRGSWRRRMTTLPNPQIQQNFHKNPSRFGFLKNIFYIDLAT